MPGTRWTPIALWAASLLVALDLFATVVLGPEVHKELDLGLEGVQWAVAAHALLLALGLLAAPSFGGERGFAAGIVVFGIGALAAAVAGSPLMFAVARAAQGAGGGLVLWCAADRLGPERARFWPFALGAAAAVGPLIGGLIGWQGAFFAVAICAAAVTGVVWLGAAPASRGAAPDLPGAAPSSPGAAGARPALDLAGFALLAAAAGLLCFGLIRTGDAGWRDGAVVISLVAVAVLVAALVAVEHGRSRPFLDVSQLARPEVAAVAVGAFAAGAAVLAVLPLLAIYLESQLSHSVAGAGLRLLALAVPALVVGLVAGRWIPANLTIGLVCLAAGLVVLRAPDAGDGWGAMVVGLVIAGAGVGLCGRALAIAATRIAPAFAALGLAVGIAAWGAPFGDGLEPAFRGNFPTLFGDAVEGDLVDFVAFGGAERAGNPGFAALGRQAFLAGLDDVLLQAAILAVAAAVLVALLVQGSRQN